MNEILIFTTSITFLLIITLLWTRHSKPSTDLMLVAERNVSWVVAVFSVTVAWTWAPALLVSSQKSYELGVAGFFWFAIPNVFALIFFFFLIRKMRAINPQGYTLPEFIEHRMGASTHKIYIVTIFLVQIYAIVINLLGSTYVLSHMTGLERSVLLPSIMLVALIIASFRGLYSSVHVDLLKTIFIISLCIVFLLFLPEIFSGNSIQKQLMGKNNNGLDVFNLKTMLTYGIPTAISLFAAISIDQQQWQRGFSIQSDNSLKRVYIFAFVFFTIIMIMMAVPGFVASTYLHRVENTQIVTFYIMDLLFPKWVVFGLMLMILVSLVAVISAALCASASIFYIDIYKKNWDKDNSSKPIRWFMVLFITIAAFVVFIPDLQIIWLQMFVGSFRSALIVPTVMALFITDINQKSRSILTKSIIVGMMGGPIIYILGLSTNTPELYAIGSLFPLATTTIGYMVSRK